MSQIQARRVQCSVILDGYPSNEKFIVYRTPFFRDHKFMACLFIKPSNITGYWTVCHNIGNTTQRCYECTINSKVLTAAEYCILMLHTDLLDEVAVRQQPWEHQERDGEEKGHCSREHET